MTVVLDNMQGLKYDSYAQYKCKLLAKDFNKEKFLEFIKGYEYINQAAYAFKNLYDTRLIDIERQEYKDFYESDLYNKDSNIEYSYDNFIDEKIEIQSNYDELRIKFAKYYLDTQPNFSVNTEDLDYLLELLSNEELINVVNKDYNNFKFYIHNTFASLIEQKNIGNVEYEYGDYDRASAIEENKREFDQEECRYNNISDYLYELYQYNYIKYANNLDEIKRVYADNDVNFDELTRELFIKDGQLTNEFIYLLNKPLVKDYYILLEKYNNDDYVLDVKSLEIIDNILNEILAQDIKMADLTPEQKIEMIKNTFDNHFAKIEYAINNNSVDGLINHLKGISIENLNILKTDENPYPTANFFANLIDNIKVQNKEYMIIDVFDYINEYVEFSSSKEYLNFAQNVIDIDKRYIEYIQSDRFDDSMDYYQFCLKNIENNIEAPNYIFFNEIDMIKILKIPGYASDGKTNLGDEKMVELLEKSLLKVIENCQKDEKSLNYALNNNILEYSRNNKFFNKNNLCYFPLLDENICKKMFDNSKSILENHKKDLENKKQILLNVSLKSDNFSIK